MDIVDILYTEIHHSLRVITYIASHVSHLYSDGLSQEQKSDSTTRKSYLKGKYFNFHTWYISFLSIHCWILFWNSIQKSIKQQSQMSEYPCGICKVEVQKNDAAILCKLCNKWNHINCVQVNLMTYEKLKSNPTLWHCPLCINELTFANTSKSDFINLYCSSPPLSVSCELTVKSLGKKAKQFLKRIKDLNHTFNQSESLISHDYFDIKDLKKVKIKSQDLSILHLNISSI